MLLQKALWPHSSLSGHQKDKQVYLRGQDVKTSLESNVSSTICYRQAYCNDTAVSGACRIKVTGVHGLWIRLILVQAVSIHLIWGHSTDRGNAGCILRKFQAKPKNCLRCEEMLGKVHPVLHATLTKVSFRSALYHGFSAMSVFFLLNRT